MKVIIDNKEINLIIADSFFKRLKGFMFKKNINYSIRFKTNNIHTFFMKENIDIVMTNKDNKVLYILKNVKKNKIIIKKDTYFTYEFPAKFINNLKINDILKIIN